MMVAKDIDPFKSQHDYEQAGQTALERIAATLKQDFKQAPKAISKMTIRLFHGLRFDNGSYAVQFDHLVIHQYGLILIENRGEPSDISVNPLGEWTQIYKAAELRISSPLTQGDRKLGFLKSYLEEHAHLLLQGRSSNQAFSPLSFELLVAISDEGEFRTAPGMAMPRICRSSDSAKRVISLIQKQQDEAKKRFGLGYHKEKVLTGDEVFKVTSFLRAQHKALERESRVVASEDKSEQNFSATAISEAQGYFICKSCGGNQLFIDHEGGYRVVCMDCSAIMMIDRTCQHCSRQGFVSRNGNEYFIECEACLRAELIFVDPVR